MIVTEDNLLAVQPHLLTNNADELTSVDEIHLPTSKKEETTGLSYVMKIWNFFLLKSNFKFIISYRHKNV